MKEILVFWCFVLPLFVENVIAKTVFINANSSTTSTDITWTGKLTLNGGFEVKWKNNDSEFIILEMSGPTKGYVAVGFSSNGAMKGSDIVMGWVDSNGKPHLKDLYAVGNSAPLEDNENNCELLYSLEKDDRTTIRFRRHWNTCDTKYDKEITDDTIRLIYAWGNEDPASSSRSFTPIYHGADARGVQSVYLKSPAPVVKFPDDLETPDPDIKSWDVRIENNTLNGEESLYFCKIVKAPHIEERHQIIGYRPLLNESNKAWIHHMVFYECIVPEEDGGTEEPIFEKYVSHSGGECYTPNMPPDWGKYCTTISLVWAVGGDGVMFTEKFGMPLGEPHSGRTYFMFEIHYDNPKKLTFTDNSGMRVFLTVKPREYNSGTFAVGNRVSAFDIVPPGASSFKNMGYCTTECTEKVFPPEGITVSHVMLHSHTSSRKMMLRHIRNGTELLPIALDNFYDFNYQQFRTISPERKVLPGDILLAECTFDTSKRTEPTYGGMKSKEEMCTAFILYYPQIPLAGCTTQREFHSFFDALGINKVEGDILEKVQYPYIPKEGQKWEPHPWNEIFQLNVINSTRKDKNIFDGMNIVDPLEKSNSTVGEYLRSVKWSENQTLTKQVESKWLHGRHYAFCLAPSFQRIPLKDYIVSYPKFQKFQSPVDEKCKYGKSSFKIGTKPYPQVRSFGYFNQ